MNNKETILLKKQNETLKNELLSKKRALQIEAALEKVRAVAMKMMKPDDLLKICKVQFHELKKLGFVDIRNALIGIYHDEQNYFTDYDYSDFAGGNIHKIPYNKNSVVDRSLMRMKSASDAFTEFVVEGNELKKWKAFRKQNGEYDDTRISNAKVLYYYFYSISRGNIGISTFKKISEEQSAILKRFRNVFDLAYKRYVDITNAEAQAMEAQVEASLEKVRAQAMSIRNSEELGGVGKIIFKELKFLGFADTRNVEIIIYKEDKNIIRSFYCDYGINGSIDVDAATHPTIKKWLVDLKKSSDSFVSVHISEKEMKAWRKYRESLGYLPDLKLNKAKTVEYYSYSIGLGALSVSSFKPLTDEQLKTLERFKNVFGLAYRRYMDVAKAEAQAKEARIETALERIRAASMAMKKSDELINISEVMFKELLALGFSNLRNTQIAIDDPINQTYNGVDFSASGAAILKEISYETSPMMKELVTELKKSKDAYYEKEISGSEFQTWLSWRKRMGPLNDPKLKSVKSLSFYLHSVGTGMIGISAYGTITGEQHEILQRFRNVYELSYSRFSDLQKAEAQAKEAHIQLALERVRARTMAMQKSDELAETAFVLFQQFQELGEDPEQIGIGIMNEEENIMELWSTINGKMRERVVKVPLDEPILINKLYKAWKEDKKSLIVDLSGKNLEDYNKFRNSLAEIKIDISRTKDRRIVSAARFSKGHISLATTEPRPAETMQLLERFANVFDLTYTRFLDLKNAEAQTKEAKIEAALEKVRSRSLAMHKSDELNEIVTILFEKLKELQIPVTAVGITIYIEGSKDMNAYVCGQNADGLVINNYRLPYFHHKISEDFNNTREKQLDFFIGNYSKEEKNSFYKYVFEHAAELRYLPDDIKNLIFESPTYTITMLAVKNALFNINDFEEKILSENEVDIIKRFAKVFDQAYTRFLDLQKAEAQSRESQIQLALERARSQSMIMQHSNELDDALRVFHEQVLLLNIPSAFSFLWLPDEEKDKHIFWAAWKENNLFKSKAINYPLDRNEPATAQCLIDWKGKEPIVSYHVAPAGVANYFAAWQELINGVEQLKPEYFSGGLYYVEAFMKYGCFGVIVTNDLTEDEKKLLGRFAVEFERTYTRFLDLQKAEIQTRESQIQLALERVRARTMAMQKSDELPEAANILFQQVQSLGMPAWSAGYCLFNEDKSNVTAWMSSEGVMQPPFSAPTTEDELFIEMRKGSSKTLHVVEMGGEKLVKHYEYMRTLPVMNEILDSIIAAGYPLPAFQIMHQAYFSKGFLLFITYKPVPASHDIFKRFANVFEQTYTRFLDLQKAEAQAREAQIEVAVERVRAQSMAMHQTNDLDKVNKELYNQLQSLNVDGLSGVSIYFLDENGDVKIFDLSSPGNMTAPNSYSIKFNSKKFKTLGNLWQHYKNEEEYFILYYSLEKLKAAALEFREVDVNIANVFEQAIKSGSLIHQWNAFGKIAGGLLGVDLMAAPSEDTKTIVLKMAGAFNLAYKRFLDLQKAEAQTREAQIEVALERVRAKAMSMHKSEDLHAAVAVVFEELKKLDLGVLRCGISILNKEKRCGKVWLTSTDGDKAVQVTGDEPFDIHPLLHGAFEAWLKQEDFYYVLEGDDLVKYYKAVKNAAFWLPESQMHISKTTITQYCFVAVYNSGGLFSFQETAFTEEAKKIMRRFANVFDLTYKRFLDLQKAEAQAREAQIQLALERVRARTMAMQRSGELAETAAVLFKQFKDLGSDPIQITIGIFNEEKKEIELQVTDWDGSGIKVGRLFSVSTDEPSVGKKMYQAWKEKKRSLVIDLTGKELAAWIKYRNALSNTEDSHYQKDKRRVISFGFFSKGAISVSTAEPCSEETINTLERFANVFDSTYTRFLDLQKAEAQAREAQIEAALEKVRSKSMAMYSSNDLSDAATMVFAELNKLGIKPIRTGVGIISKTSKNIQFYSATSSSDGNSLALIGGMSMMGHPEFEKQYEHWLKNENYYKELNGEELISYYNFLNKGLNGNLDINIEKNHIEYGHWLMFPEGFLFAWSEKEYTNEELKILDRFKNIIALTFKRYFELQKSEAQAREAQIETALERVRSRTLAMQKSDELAETAAVLFRQLILLGIQPNRLYIAIVKEENGNIEFWITDEDGSKVSSAFETNSNDNPVFKKMFDGWKAEKKSMVINMQGEELQEYFRYLTSINVPFKDGLTQKRRVQDIAYFNNGFIGMASPEEQPAETLKLLERFAYVFNLTFTRFNDLKLAEAHAIQAEQDLIAIKEAKQKAEAALSELQVTQKQLVQSEKMASLGELTAGIAHEIQNPLNFVNNFSEVSVELIREMIDEVEKGNTAEVKSLADDIVQNLEKINHHGKRADGIVKGMLQHSRTSSGQKELTDINTLADEYLRLAFHGLRAKDKSFNAKFETHFELSLPKINVVPQDIGRVLLNLINNAFYAVTEKQNVQRSTLNVGYAPTVSISTKKANNKIEINITDNGNGIPSSIKEKIFQPFFTTKPTGQGTGLGLSLSYDIVKAHGGELKVETKESEGTSFIIQLPVK